jgi:hypothetical protein
MWPATAQFDNERNKLHGCGIRMGDFIIDIDQASLNIGIVQPFENLTFQVYERNNNNDHFPFYGFDWLRTIQKRQELK